jgi:anti-sigma factor RsiW
MKRTNPHHPQRNCLALFERLSEYIDSELDTPTCKTIEAHIKACRPCRVCLQTLKQTVNLCRHLERRQVPETFSLKLKESILNMTKKEFN